MRSDYVGVPYIFFVLKDILASQQVCCVALALLLQGFHCLSQRELALVRRRKTEALERPVDPTDTIVPVLL